MELILKRIAKKKGYTIGRLYSRTENTEEREGTEDACSSTIQQNSVASDSSVNSVYICDTLEPQWRDYAKGAYKVKGKSAITEGRYAVVITYSPKFKMWLPLLLGVRNFSGIRIHAGNTVKDTQGCILVGENREVGKVLNSRKHLNIVKSKIVEAKENGEGVWIEIR